MHRTPLDRINELELWRADIMDFIYEVHDRMHPYDRQEKKDSLKAICKRVNCEVITAMMVADEKVMRGPTRNPFKMGRVVAPKP